METAIVITKKLVVEEGVKRLDKILMLVLVLVYIPVMFVVTLIKEQGHVVSEVVNMRSEPEFIGPRYTPVIDNSSWGYPLERGCGTITQHYGPTSFNPFHNGVDIAQSGGCKIVATNDGIVDYVGWHNGGCGYTVVLYHYGGIKSQYCHGSGVMYVVANQVVIKGQPIMYMGSSGNSTGTHLHFMIFLDGKLANPNDYVKLY